MLVPERERTRADYIAGLRMLADLLEQVPQIPQDRHQSISFALEGSEAEALETVNKAAAALTAAGIEFERDDHSGVNLVFVLAGARYSFSKLSESVWADLEAQQSDQAMCRWPHRRR